MKEYENIIKAIGDRMAAVESQLAELSAEKERLKTAYHELVPGKKKTVSGAKASKRGRPRMAVKLYEGRPAVEQISDGLNIKYVGLVPAIRWAIKRGAHTTQEIHRSIVCVQSGKGVVFLPRYTVAKTISSLKSQGYIKNAGTSRKAQYQLAK